mmetsp:Transcript_41989/g.48318  ORF Transcript_41989/g.48318 Transcript_41989/m.48318 type:complete len:129 (+) Transcript_41989:1122-1508(+)
MPFVPNLAILPIDFPCEENSTQKSTMSGPKEDCPLHDEQTNSNVGLLKKFQHFVEMQTTYRNPSLDQVKKKKEECDQQFALLVECTRLHGFNDSVCSNLEKPRYERCIGMLEQITDNFERAEPKGFFK